jgi:hypothetical protein
MGEHFFLREKKNESEENEAYKILSTVERSSIISPI